MAEEAARGVFVINEEEVPFPDFSDGYTMDEAMAFYDYTGFPLEELIVSDDMDDEEREAATRKMRGPHVLSALMHIGYCRAHPKAADSSVRKLVRATSFVEAFSRFADTVGPEADETVPPSVESTSTPSESSTSKPVGSENTNEPSNKSSGSGSQNGSSEPESHPATTGAGSSDTSSPVSAQTTLAP